MAGDVLITASGRVILGSGGGVAIKPPVVTLPGIPVGLTVGLVTSSSVALSWSPPATGTPPFTSYTVIYSTSSTGPWTTFGTFTTTSTTVTGLSPTTNYYFAVAASNATGTGQYTAPASTTTTSNVSGGVIATLQVRNGQAAARTAPPVQAGHVFAPGHVPAGSYPEIRPTGSGTALPHFQWDQISTRKDGSWYFAIASFKADGNYAAYKSTGDTLGYDLVVTAGTPPYSTSTVTPSTIAAASQFYMKLYGVDFTAEAGAGDYYYGDLNYILANYPRDTWGTNPTGGWELVSSGAVGNKYWGWMCARRHSDNAIHKWLVVAFEVMAWASGEFTVNPVVMQPWIYDAHPFGTLGPAKTAQPNFGLNAQPRYAGFYELWDLKSNTLIGARGGPNDSRIFTFPASSFETTSGWFTLPANVLSYPSGVPGGGMTQGTGWLFTAASGGTLPSNIDPNWVYWIGNIASGHAQIVMERAISTGSQPYPGSSGLPDSGWSAGMTIPSTQFGSFTWISRNNAGYVYIASGTTGSTGPVPNPIGSGANPARLDGTAKYLQANPYFGSPGSGNVTATPVCATFGSTAVDFKDENAQPYWFDPVNHSAAPRTLPMMDFNYATKSTVIHPFEFHTPTPVPDSDPGVRYLSSVEKYFPNDMFQDFGQGAWDVMRAPGDDIMDNRLGAWNQRQALRLYQPGDRNTAQNARVMAARFFGFHHWGWDHRSGRLPLINLGPARNGSSDYPGYPTGTLNPNLTWLVYPPDNTFGSPAPMGQGYDNSLTALVYRHMAGYVSTYGQAVNGSHCPNPSMGDRVINGDYLALQEMQAIHFGVLSTPYPQLRNNIAGFPGLGGLVDHDAAQARANGWDTVKQCTILIFTPDWHLMKPYYRDNLADQSTYFSGLAAWVSSSVSPKLVQWGLTGSLVATVGGITTLWGLSHGMEGMAYGAMALAGDYPGFKTATDNFLLNLTRIWDPANGGCMYYVGLDFVNYGTSADPNSLPSDLATMAMQPNICGNPDISGTYNLFGQTPGGSFVCPGVGGNTPGHMQINGNGTNNFFGGTNIIDGGQIWGGQPFCAGNVRVDAAAIPMQNIAPVAVAANMPGANPRYSTMWHAARTRMTVGGMTGPTFAGMYVPANTGSYGSFQYCYAPPS